LSNKTTIDLLRHGKPIGGRRYRGQLDDPLSESGWQEMWYATSAETPWQTIISSPLCRCREFAQQLSDKLSLPFTIDDRLKEVGFGAWEGQSADMLRAQDDAILKRFYHDPINNRPANAEPLESFSRRVDEALQTAIQTHQGKHILIVTHAGVIRIALASILGAPLGSMYRLSIATASLSRIRIEEQRPPTVTFVGRRRL
jgi:alpha-ribazole phosphatase/probable phosphoglycerate mutase